MPALHKKAMLVALFVGTILNLINQYPQLTSGASLNWLQITITYMVPYFVSFFSAKMANNDVNVTDNNQEKTEPSNKFEIHQHIVADIEGQVQQMLTAAKVINQCASLKGLVVDEAMSDVRDMMVELQSQIALTQVSLQGCHAIKHHFTFVEHENWLFKCKETASSAQVTLQAIQAIIEECKLMNGVVKKLDHATAQRNVGALPSALETMGHDGTNSRGIADEEGSHQMLALLKTINPLVNTLFDKSNLLMQKMNDFSKQLSHLSNQQESHIAIESVDVLLDNLHQVDEYAKKQSVLLDSLTTKVSQLADDSQTIQAESQRHITLSDDISSQLSKLG